MAIALGSASAIAAPQDCLIADLDGNGLVDEADLEIVRRQLGRTCPPRIDAITPSVGAIGQASTITIEGLALGSATSVTIGGLPATIQLELPKVYADMTGTGELWVGADGMPLRQRFALQFPEDQHNYQAWAGISVDFADFAPLRSGAGSGMWPV